MARCTRAPPPPFPCASTPPPPYSSLLAQCVFKTPPATFQSVTATLLSKGALAGPAGEAAAAGAAMVAAHDTGDMPHLDSEQTKRSSAMHDPAFRARLAANSGGRGGKRPRPAADTAAPVEAAPEEEGEDGEEGLGDTSGSSYKDMLDSLKAAHSTPAHDAACAAKRFEKVKRFVESSLDELGIAPNARSYVLLVKAAVDAGDVAAARAAIATLF